MVLTYSGLTPKGFSFLPYQASKMPGYGKIFASFIGFYMMGHAYVQNQLGDKKHYNYLYMNKGGILAGTKSWEKSD